MNLKLAIYIFLLLSCVDSKNNTSTQIKEASIIPAAERIEQYVPFLKDKNIALVVNQTSTVGQQHLLDTLLNLKLNVKRVFSPEHGFRGKANAGEKIKDGLDPKTGIPIASLYGKQKKPSDASLNGIDVVVFDIQDVGVRFYTYISTLHYVMEACAENEIPLILLDRPNPNGFYIDGPVLEPNFESFVGMHPVPVVYGMTIGEYGKMINGESWLKNGIKCNLTVIELANYDHNDTYDLPVKPSPNLPNLKSILLYPSLCFFEGTSISIGRGTDNQFQVIGHPKLNKNEYHFTPVSKEGATNPKHKNTFCYGSNLTLIENDQLKSRAKLDLSYLLDYYKQITVLDDVFFTNPDFFDLLAGTDQLRKDIISNKSLEKIEQTWSLGLSDFKKVRKEYLLYPDFN